MITTTTKSLIINARDYKGLGNCLDYACDYMGTGNNYQNDNTFIFADETIEQHISDMQDNLEDENLDAEDKQSIELALNTLKGIYQHMQNNQANQLIIK